MINWNNNKYNCNNKIDYIYIKLICKKLKIKLYSINLSYTYWKQIFTLIIKKYKKIKSLIPDVICNKKIKFNLLIKRSKQIIKVKNLATGHYSNIIKNKYNKYNIYKSYNKNKNQTFFLSQIQQKYVKYIIFPLSNYKKNHIKHIIYKKKIINLNKKDSYGLCFIGKKNNLNFLQKYTYKNIGYIINQYNYIINIHKGNKYYTIGQKISYNNNKIYIQKKYKKLNILKTVRNKQNKLLFISKTKKYNKYNYNLKQININIEKTNLNFIYKNIFYKKKYYTIIFLKKPNRILSKEQYIIMYKKNKFLYKL